MSGERDAKPIYTVSKGSNPNHTLARLLSNALTHTQILLLYRIRDNSYYTITQLIDVISEDNRLAKSTLRSNAARLREAGLIDCGTADNKGIPVTLTSYGKSVVYTLNGQMVRS